MSNHISEQRKKRVQQVIKAKIKNLQEWLAEGLPKGTFVPKNMKEFRSWEDAALNLEKIGSPNTMDKPHNRELKRTAETLIEALTKKRRQKESNREVSRLLVQMNEKDTLIKDLTDQWHATRQERDQAQKAARRSQSRLLELQNENGELTRKLSSLIPLKPVA